MGQEPPWEGLNPAEAAYYQAVEDAFARLRGTPFWFSPKDWALLERWWREGVALGAVLAGVAEVFARRRERGDDPVSSLAFCRHAVARHWRRLSSAGVGGEEPIHVDVPGGLARCAAELDAAARQWESCPALAEGIAALAAMVRTLPASAPPAALDQALANLEAEAVERLAALLPAACREAAQRRVQEVLAEVSGDPQVVERTRRALQLREWRRELGLPRLELAPDG